MLACSHGLRVAWYVIKVSRQLAAAPVQYLMTFLAVAATCKLAAALKGFSFDQSRKG